jgi:hypothetical protein
MLNPADLRRCYDEAFRLFEQALTKRASEPRFERLFELVAFRRDNVRWAESAKDGVIRSIESGPAPPAWFVAISPDDPTARTQPGVYSTDWISPAMVGTCIRPDPITTAWSALGLVKGLEHLEAEVSGREPKIRPVWQHHAEDVRSYESEILAADVLSSDRFGRAISEALKSNHLTDGKEVAAFARSHRLWSVLRPLTLSVTEEPPLSPGEDSVRGGLCLVALGFRAVEGFANDPETEFEQKVRFVQKLVPPPPRPG